MPHIRRVLADFVLVLDSCARWTEEDKTATVSLCDLWEWTPRNELVWNYRMPWFEELFGSRSKNLHGPSNWIEAIGSLRVKYWELAFGGAARL